MRKNALAALGAAFALAAAASGQETEAAPPAPSASIEYGFELGIGTETLVEDPTEPQDDETNPLVTYQKLALQPGFSFGKFDVAVDLSVHFNLDLGSGGDGVDFYEPDWVPKKAGKSFLELYLPKIAYVRYGQKGDPLFAKLGSFDDGTLGNGFIMGNYANTRFLPATRVFGAAFDVDGALLDFPYLGVETFVGNVAIMDVIGSRLYARPLSGTELPLLKGIQVGATVAADREPQYYDADEDNDSDGDAVAVYGADFKLPVLEREAASAALFGDAAFQNRGRWGSAVGVGGTVLKYGPYTAQLRLLGPDFVPTYFDGSYDLFRSVKYAQMEEDPSGDLFAGWLAGLGFAVPNLVSFRVAADGPFGPAPEDSLSFADYPHVRATFALAEGILGGFSADALYEKYLLGAPKAAGGTGSFWGDLFDPENAIIAARLNYHTGPAVISLIHNLRYDPETGDFIVTASLMTSIRF